MKIDFLLWCAKKIKKCCKRVGINHYFYVLANSLATLPPAQLVMQVFLQDLTGLHVSLHILLHFKFFISRRLCCFCCLWSFLSFFFLPLSTVNSNPNRRTTSSIYFVDIMLTSQILTVELEAWRATVQKCYVKMENIRKEPNCLKTSLLSQASQVLSALSTIRDKCCFL